ncbi:Zinc carboxypeptidase [Luteitalea pratensis]|uniref:Zinc carboxypeptidase n=1 Tax=Luteitalea pratensis TaxID=1855912 RepID=A0A143PRJ3_LUTPR|nr:M14 family metallopeptidase [Luteitalea pratensis]AMY11031.1 Zinc carboxypeptidase [Luteitalea pratensis]
MLRPRVRVIRALSFVVAASALAGVRQPAGSSLWSPSLAAQAQTATPSPEQFFGYRMGADRKLATWDRLLEYYRAVAQSSDRVKLVELGITSERRPYIALFISSPANLARLDEYRRLNAILADPRGAAPADIERATRDGRAVIIQTFGLHSSEVAAAQTAAEFVYDSVTRDDGEATRIRDEVISIVVPSINPDGTQMIADWYMKYVGTEFEATPLPWLYQTYAGHDNNRDGFALNLPESRNLARILYREWMPQAYVDHHQMGNTNARLYIPPYAEPIRPDGDPLVWREMAWWGAHMGTQLEAAGKTGVVGAAIYSGWGHMGFHWITPFHNIAGMLTESASARLATPMFLHPDQLRGGPRNLPEYAPQTNMPSVWPGGWWRVRDIVEQQKIAAWATVDLAARNRETVLHNMYLKASRQVERGTTGPVKAYVLPAGQHDALTVRKLVNMLLASGVEVHEATAQVIVDGRVYGPGSFVVSMAQPKQALVRWMLGRTFYPDNSYTRERDGTPIRPYDMSTDTFGEFMGVRSDPVGEPVPVASLTRISEALVAPSVVAPSAPQGYVLDGRLNDSYRAVLLLLAKGIGVRRAQVASADGSVRQGDFLVAPGDVTAIAARAGVPFAALSAPFTSETTTLATPRIGLFQRYRGGNMDEGWTRLLFEQFDVPFTTVRDADLKAPGLASKFDVIVLPADSLTAMTGEDPPAGARGGGGGEGGEGASQRTTPPEYRSGFGADGVKALQAFVEAGGTLLTFGQAGDLPMQRFGLPLRNAVAGVSAKEFWSPGSTLRVRYANDHPLAYGMPKEGLALFMSGSQVYEVTSTDRSQDVAILATYADRDLLQSGWLLGEQVIARKAAAVVVTQGKGRVVLIGFRPQNRAQTHGTFKLVFNALMVGR